MTGDHPREPIFIIGNPRSGTTLLRLMVTCHPNICVPPEAGFALWLAQSYGDWRENDPRLEDFLDALFASRKFETWSLEREPLAAEIEAASPSSYSALVDLIYGHYARQHKPGARRWGDKNNFYLEHIAGIHRLFPGAKFVHIVRDPRDVACSYRELQNQATDSAYRPNLPGDVTAIAEQWKTNIERVEADLDALNPALSHRLRYEDLVSDSAGTLRKLCEFLGEEFDDAMLDYHRINRDQALEPADFLAWKQLTLSPPEASRVGRYRQDLSSAEAERIAREAEPAFSRYYQPDR